MSLFHKQLHTPDGWRAVFLGDVIKDIKSGLSRKLSDRDIGLPVIRSNNIADTKLDVSDIKYWYKNDPQGANTSLYFVDDKDILLNFINSIAQIGKVALYRNELNRKAIYTTNILKIKIKKDILPEYFIYLAKTNVYSNFIRAITNPAVNQASFTTKELKKFYFPLPPTYEQEKIIAILHAWDQAINKIERLIKVKRRLKKGLMQQFLTGKRRLRNHKDIWQDCIVKDFGKVITGTTPSKSCSDYYGDQFPWATAEDFNGKYIKDTIAKLSNKGKKVVRVLPKGSVLVTCIASIGKNAIAGCELSTNQQINSIIVNKKHNNEFVFYLIDYFRNKLIAWAGVTAVPILNKKTFEKVPFTIPANKEEQKAISSILATADHEIEMLQKRRGMLHKQKKGLMQKLLSGKIRVKV